MSTLQRTIVLEFEKLSAHKNVNADLSTLKKFTFPLNYLSLPSYKNEVKKELCRMLYKNYDTITNFIANLLNYT